MKSPWIVAIVLVAMGLGLEAQNHPDGLLIGGTRIHLVQGGVRTSLFDNPGSAYGMQMDVDNKLIFFGDHIIDGWVRLDPATSTTVAVNVDQSLFDLTGGAWINQDGDYICAGSGPGIGYGLYRVSGAGVSTITTTLKLGIPGTMTGGVIRDIDNGNYILQLYGGTVGNHPLISVAPDGTATTILANLSSTHTPRFYMTQDIRTSDYYVGANDSNQGVLFRVKKGGQSTIVATSTNRFAFNALVTDRGSSVAPRIISSYISTLFYTDLKTYQVTSSPIAPTAASPRSTTIYRSRNVQTVRSGNRTWDLLFSFPIYGGKTYATGMTIGGIRPGVVLPDGRNILANVDPLLVLTVRDLVRPLFNPGPGALDANGEARGSLDLSSLPSNLGVSGHIIAIVLDPNASQGIADIADPFLFRL